MHTNDRDLRERKEKLDDAEYIFDNIMKNYNTIANNDDDDDCDDGDDFIFLLSILPLLNSPKCLSVIFFLFIYSVCEFICDNGDGDDFINAAQTIILLYRRYVRLCIWQMMML